MKILGEKSLSSKVELGLEIVFVIIALLDIVVLAVLGIVTKSEFSRYSITVEQILNSISIVVTLGTVLLTGIIALYIIYQFIKIFRNLKENQLFNNDNSVYLKRISNLCIVMGVLYFIVLISLICFVKNLYWDMVSRLMCILLVFTFSIAFLVFGIGIKILNEIYKKAIEFKEENELTI